MEAKAGERGDVKEPEIERHKVSGNYEAGGSREARMHVSVLLGDP